MKDWVLGVIASMLLALSPIVATPAQASGGCGWIHIDRIHFKWNCPRGEHDGHRAEGRVVIINGHPRYAAPLSTTMFQYTGVVPVAYHVEVDRQHHYWPRQRIVYAPAPQPYPVYGGVQAPRALQVPPGYYAYQQPAPPPRSCTWHTNAGTGEQRCL